MNLKDYQRKSKRTLNRDLNVKEQTFNMLLGVEGEFGEVIDEFKKFFFQGHKLNVSNIDEEIGDTMFYLVNLCNLIGLDLEDIIENNYNKLLKRFPDGFDENKSINRSE